MVAYSFKPQFVEPIRWGLGLGLDIADGVVAPKRQTIRAIGKKRHAREGEMLQLYTGMRTKQCRQIGTARCVSVKPILLDLENKIIETGGVRIPRRHLDNFARDDGFAHFEDMRDFWRETHGLGYFKGIIIKWEPTADIPHDPTIRGRDGTPKRRR